MAAFSFLLLGVGGTQALAGAGTPDGPSAGAASNSTGLAQLQECVSNAKRVEVLYVMDESGSLNNTDVGGERFGALETSVAQLGALAESEGSGKIVEAALAAFGDGFVPPRDIKTWTEIPAQGADKVAADFRDAATSAWANAKDAKFGTNYSDALEGGKQALLDRGSDVGTCRLLIWFTDGLFDIGSPAATDVAAEKMCARGNLVDELRVQGISLVALALFNEAVGVELAKPEKTGRRGELQAIATGTGEGRDCGTVPISTDSRSGIYLPVSSSTELGLLFSGAIAQGSGGTNVPTDSTRPVTVNVEPGVRKFQVDLAVATPPAQIGVTSPDGTTATVSVDGAPMQVSGGLAAAHGYDSMVSVTVSMPGSGTRGTWQVNAGPASRAEVYLFSGLTLVPSAQAPSRLVAGQDATIPMVATDPSGAPADLSLYGQISLQVEATVLKDPVVASITVGDARKGETNVKVSLPGDATGLRIKGSITPTLVSEAVLAPVTFDLSLPATLPAAFPAIEPTDGLDLGTQAGVEALSGTVEAVGSAEGPTAVCFAASENVQVPERADGVSVRGPDGCVELAVGESKSVPIGVSTNQSADGRASADIPVQLQVRDANGATLQSAPLVLPVTWTMVRPVDQIRRLLLILGLVLLAIALPLLAMWLSNRALARFAKGNIRVSRKEVRLSAAGPVAADGTPVFSATDLAHGYIADGQRRRYADAGGGLLDLVAVAPINPFGGPSFRAVATKGYRVVGGDAPRVVHSGAWTPVTQGLGAVYLMVASDEALGTWSHERPEISATLVLLTRSNDERDLEELVRRVAHRFEWSTVLEDLSHVARQNAPAPEGGPPPTRAFSADPDPFDPWSGPDTALPSGGWHSRPPARSAGVEPFGSTSHTSESDPYA